jgi:DNA-binding transcriptional regulator YiaG
MTAADILAWRERHELSQTQAGALMGVGLRTWQKWEYAERQAPPPVVRLCRLIDARPGLIRVLDEMK